MDIRFTEEPRERCEVFIFNDKDMGDTAILVQKL